MSRARCSTSLVAGVGAASLDRRRCSLRSRWSRSGSSRTATRSTASAASGKDGAPFEMLKLRTMVTGAEHIGAGPGRQRGRHAHHPRRRAPAPHLARRAAEPASTCCAARCRSSGRGPTVQVQVDQYTDAPARPARGQAGHHRLGAGQRPRVAAVARAHRARPLVRRAPLAAARPADPGARPCGWSSPATASTRARRAAGRTDAT